MDVVFTDGSVYSPKLRHRFGKNSRSHAIDLPGARRTIKEVRFKYSNVPGGGSAQLELWGLP